MNDQQKQEFFDNAVRGLWSQGWKRSVDEKGFCRYRGPDGCRCALGWNIPDERYTEDIEGLGAETPELLAALGLCSTDSETINWLGDLQFFHDDYRASNPAVMRANLREFASNNHLIAPQELDEP